MPTKPNPRRKSSTTTPSPAGYSGTPLPKKLGIKPGGTAALISAPRDFATTLGELPVGAKLQKGAGRNPDVRILFVRSFADLRKQISLLETIDDEAPAWIAWPKKTSPLASDVTEREVRELGLAAKMVDYKICAIDADWSGLLFSRKRKK